MAATAEMAPVPNYLSELTWKIIKHQRRQILRQDQTTKKNDNNQTTIKHQSGTRPKVKDSQTNLLKVDYVEPKSKHWLHE